MSEINFVNVQLGDNDFGRDIQAALTEGCHYQKSFDQTAWKKYIISHLLGTTIHQLNCTKFPTYVDWSILKTIENYLKAYLHVRFEKYRPSRDCDGGSACLDLHTGIAWTY